MIPSPAPEPPASPNESMESVRRAQRGDLAAFEAMYRAHAGRVTALCLRLTGDRPRAEELMQDVFVRAWEKLGSFRGESSFSTWLHRLAVNLFLMGARADSRRVARIEATGELDDLVATGFGADDTANRIDLDRAIARLPTGARTAFVLHDIEGYRHEEIAALSGIAPATVRAQLHRAHRLLMEALNR